MNMLTVKMHPTVKDISDCYRKLATSALILAGRDYYLAYRKGKEDTMRQILMDLPASPIWFIMDELNVSIDDFRSAAEKGLFNVNLGGKENGKD